MKKKTTNPERLAIREITRRLNQTNTAKQFGFIFREIAPGRVVVGMRVAKRHLQVHGVVHGGVLAALADTAGGMSVYMKLPPRSRVATVEMKINYLEAVAGGEVFGPRRTRATGTKPRGRRLRPIRSQSAARGESPDDLRNYFARRCRAGLSRLSRGGGSPSARCGLGCSPSIKNAR